MLDTAETAAPTANSDARAEERPCLNCGTGVPEAYCPRCGQDYEKANRLSFRELFYDAVRVLHYDGALFSSLRLLITRPGLLTRDYVAGRRTSHVNPGRLFFLVLVASFFIANILDSSTIEEWLGEERFAEVAERSGLPPEAVEAQLSNRADTAYRLGIFLIIPLLTALAGILHLRRRRPFLVHAVYALHLITFFLIITTIIETADFIHTSAGDVVMIIAVLIAFPWYIYRSFRAVHGQSRLLTGGKSLVMYVGLIVVLVAYILIIEEIIVYTF